MLAAVGEMSALRISEVFAADRGRSLRSIAIGVALVAAVSTMLGHTVIFLINRVRGVRLLAGMALGTVYLVLLHVLTGMVLAVVTVLAMDRASAATITTAYLLTLAPRALGFLVFIPHLGLGIGRIIEGWCLLTLMFTLAHVLQVPRWQALVVAGSAWLLTQVVSRLASRPLAGLASRIWTRLTGRPTVVTAHDILSGGPFVPLDRSTAALLR